MPPRPSPSRVAAALDYLQRLKSGVGEFVGGVGSNLADRARTAGGLAYEALTTDPNIGRMTTAEFSQAAADRAPTPRLDQAARDIGTIGRAIVTQPVETGKAIVGGEIDRFKGAFASPQALGDYAGSFIDPMRIAAALRHRIPISEIDAYHGTADDFEAFDPKMGGRATGAGSARQATWFVDKPKVAEGYAVHAAEDAPVQRKLKEADRLERIAQKSNKQQDWDKYDAAIREAEELDATKYDRRIANARLLEVDIPDETNFFEVDAKGKTPLELSKESNIDSWLQEQLRQAKKLNKQGVKIVNLDDTAGGVNSPATHYAVFDPSGVRIKSKVKILERNGQPAPERIAQALEAASSKAAKVEPQPFGLQGYLDDDLRRVKQNFFSQYGLEEGKQFSKDYEVIELSKLKPTENTNESKIQSLMKTMREEGNAKDNPIPPIIVDSEGNILDGHHRYEAAKRLGAKYVPVVELFDKQKGPSFSE